MSPDRGTLKGGVTSSKWNISVCKQLFGKWYKFKTLIIQHALTQRSQEALEEAEDRITKAHRSCFNENQSNRKKGGKQIKKHHIEMLTRHQTLWFPNRRPIRLSKEPGHWPVVKFWPVSPSLHHWWVPKMNPWNRAHLSAPKRSCHSGHRSINGRARSHT